MPAFVPLPTIDRIDGEPVHLYGARLVQFLLATECTATLTDEDLRLAEHSAQRASATGGCSVQVYDRLSALRHTLALVLRARQAEQLPAAELPATRPDQPNTGPMAPLVPAPAGYPPAGDALARPGASWGGRRPVDIAF